MTVSLLLPELAGLTAFVKRAAQTVASIVVDPENEGNESDRLLSVMLHAFASAGERVADAAWGSNEPWRAILDPAVCMDYALPYAAMLAFADLPPREAGEDLDDWEARARVALTSNRPWRGTNGAIRAAAKPWLTGTKAMRIVKFHDDSIWKMQVRVLASEVIDEPRLLAAINSDFVLRAGMKCDLELVAAGTEWTIGELEDTYLDRTLEELEDDFDEIDDLETHAGGL